MLSSLVYFLRLRLFKVYIAIAAIGILGRSVGMGEFSLVADCQGRWIPLIVTWKSPCIVARLTSAKAIIRLPNGRSQARHNSPTGSSIIVVVLVVVADDLGRWGHDTAAEVLPTRIPLLLLVRRVKHLLQVLVDKPVMIAHFSCIILVVIGDITWRFEHHGS